MTRVVLVTGMSGAGRSTALKVLEDLGYEAVDNLPLELIGRVLRSVQPGDRDLAIGIDPRSRSFSPDAFNARVEAMQANPAMPTTLLFMECDDDVLRRRYTETRRRHPLAADRPAIDGIVRERQLLATVKPRADLMIDTTQLSPPDLRRILVGHFSPREDGRLTLCVMSFSFRGGLPREADLVFDMRYLDNPHWVPELKALTGLDPRVQSFIARDPDFGTTSSAILALVLPLLPRYRREGKAYLTVAFGCTGGRHRSVFLAEWLSARLREADWPVTTIHRELPMPAEGAGA
jgi:UPF0042 nucleotide-binding protein